MTVAGPPLLSLVLPVFDEEESIPGLVERLESLRGELSDAAVEVVFVDDHSTDRTPDLLKEACRRHPWMRYFRLASNGGSHVAIVAGLAQARGEAAVLLAADLQDPPELIPELLREWRAGSRIVWAVRESREGVPVRDRLAARLFYWLMNRFSNVRLPPTGSDFALLDRSVVDALLASVGSHPNLFGEIARLGFAQARVPYVKRARKFGRSKWTLGMKTKMALDAMVSFSYVPMRIMIYLGLAVSSLAFLYIVVIVALYLAVDDPIQGWASTMVAVLGLGGLQMVMLGLIGEYLWRNLEASRRRPLFFIEERLDATPERRA